jgi:hypothetical protein
MPADKAAPAHVDLAERPDRTEQGDSAIELAVPSVAKSQLDAENEHVVEIPLEKASIDAQTSAEFTPGAGGIEINKSLEKADGLPAQTAGEIDRAGEQSRSQPPSREPGTVGPDFSAQAPVEGGRAEDGESLIEDQSEVARAANEFDAAGEQSRSQPPSHERESAGSNLSLTAPAENETGQDSALIVASRSMGLEDASTSNEDANASEVSRRPEGPDTHTAPAVSPRTTIYVEKLLDRLGFDPGPVDGVIGPKTEQAILAFQKHIGSEATGTVDDELIAAMENRLFAAFEQFLETARRQSSETPGEKKADRSTKTAATAPLGDERPRKTVVRHPQDVPAKKTKSVASASETAISTKRTTQPALQSEVQEAAIPRQPILSEPPYEMVVKDVQKDIPNAFEACARSGQQTDYVKTETGFVLCEEFSFDTRVGRQRDFSNAFK